MRRLPFDLSAAVDRLVEGSDGQFRRKLPDLSGATPATAQDAEKVADTLGMDDDDKKKLVKVVAEAQAKVPVVDMKAQAHFPVKPTFRLDGDERIQ